MLPKLSRFLFCKASFWWLLLLLDKNTRYHERYIKQTPPGQFSILISDSIYEKLNSLNLTKNNFYRTNACIPWNLLLFLHDTLHLDKIKGADFTYDNTFSKLQPKITAIRHNWYQIRAA